MLPVRTSLVFSFLTVASLQTAAFIPALGRRHRPSPVTSESRRLRHREWNAPNTKHSIESWRVYGVEVHPDELGKILKGPLPAETRYVNSVVLAALWKRIAGSDSDARQPSVVRGVKVVRRSLDARLNKKRSDGEKGPRFVYVLDVDIEKTSCRKHGVRLRHQPGRMELLDPSKHTTADEGEARAPAQDIPTVVIVGAGPAGLFCALKLARSGAVKPIVLERGQPVESRGKHIGALMHRRSLDSESNFCFGEGGAGTWSDGKLTTRIGRNSLAVRFVLETLVEYGAPHQILIDGAPHLGTDNLVRLLRNMRKDLRDLGGEVHFGSKVTKVMIENGVAVGVEFKPNGAVEKNISSFEGPIMQMHADAVVLATGHSARDVYANLRDSGVKMEAKGFAVGFRIEHPQKLITKIQYGSDWGKTVQTGKRSTDAVNQAYFGDDGSSHAGSLPVPSYRLATDTAFDGDFNRSVFSFCMCPGGQIVPSSTEPNEVCVNGMSFSRRDSLWANSALVVAISPDDPVLAPYRQKHGVLAGVEFQRDMERRAAEMGGGNLTVPVQCVTDFLVGRQSTSVPSSSYRLGVKPSPCHEIYPTALVRAFRDALKKFDSQMPGYVCHDGLVHGVETRTSSPVRIARSSETMEALGVSGLFPAGEGAGFAGGIVSAAVDGMGVSDAVLCSLGVKERKGRHVATEGTFY